MPSDSAQPAQPGRTTSASSAVRVRKRSCTTRWSSPSSRPTARCLSASDCAGFSPIDVHALQLAVLHRLEHPGQVQARLATGSDAPQAASNFARAASSVTSWNPGSLFGIAPMSPPPCTLFWPRSGCSPAP